MTRKLLSPLIASLALGLGAHAAPPANLAPLEGVPRYQNIIVIIEENKSYDQILNVASAPNIAGLAAQYGDAGQFFSEVHPSEANYVAMLGGDTFGIHDDDAFYCHAGMTDPYCPGAGAAGYADHAVASASLAQQLQAKGLSWKGYYESLPAPGSLAVIAGDPKVDTGAHITPLYAVKHSGFMNFVAVQKDPHRAEHIVTYHELDGDLAAGRLPNFALIVPNQCDEMHGVFGPTVPADCQSFNTAGLIRRGDTEVGALVRRIQATPQWRSAANVAIVITFDEGAGRTREGCCAVTPDAPSNFGGGHIPTIVVTNHGPRGVKDDTPYNHYSLLRTFEDAFGISEHLAHAADTDKGVVPMVKLFAVPPSR